MSHFNRVLGKKLGSAAMAATAADSLSDVVATSAVLAGTLAGHFAHLSIDGWAGAVVAVFILKAGGGAAKDTINPLLGASPDPELVHAIREVVLSHPQVVGMHDLIIHDYGPGRRLCSFRAEVPQDADILGGPTTPSTTSSGRSSRSSALRPRRTWTPSPPTTSR